MASDLIRRSVLLAEYDRVHVGEPGNARNLIAEDPAVDAVEVVRCKDCVYQGRCTYEAVFITSGFENPYCCAGW